MTLASPETLTRRSLDPVVGRAVELKTNMRNVVQIAAKLYDARDAMRGFWCERYAEKVADYQQYIRAAMQKYGCDEMQATMKLVALLQEKEPDSGMQQALVLAGYVEMIEPSTPNAGTERTAADK
jgi:hypothetical protein